VAALALLTSVGALGMVALEGMSVPDALYFAVVTLSTVGYGDVAPHTRSGSGGTSTAADAVFITLSGYLVVIGESEPLRQLAREAVGE